MQLYTQFKSSIVWRPSAGENAEQEYNSPIDKFAVKVIKKNSETVGLLPQEFSQVSWYFLHVVERYGSK